MKGAVIKQSSGEIKPEMRARVLDEGVPSFCKVSGKEVATVDIEKTKSFFRLRKIKNLKEAVVWIVAGEYLLIQNEV